MKPFGIITAKWYAHCMLGMLRSDAEPRTIYIGILDGKYYFYSNPVSQPQTGNDAEVGTYSLVGVKESTLVKIMTDDMNDAIMELA